EGGGSSSENNQEGQGETPPVRVEVVSIETDVWVAALLAYALYPHIRRVRVVVRQQSGLNNQAVVNCIDVLELFEALAKMENWPHSFTDLQRCLPVIASYMLNGTDFTPTLSGLSSFFMFQSYFELAKNAENHQFVKALGTKIIEDGVVTGLHLERQELVKFVALAYFVKNKSLFANALPGYQVTGDKHGGEVDDTRRWVEAIQERTAEKWYGAGNLSKAAPNYDAAELCVLRMSWLVEYWLSVVPSGSPGSDASARYPIEVPKWDG
ncbi:unnamed protein product, partial [Pylaiella littoralis]